eukprot:gnl/TRDRNA2_/TRDRNA2_145066_c0_seq1.p1 gnl/TRDRNA2_/TRDRNA2_145066_c0~~gnl/TRDRNA2_/TRDRNA2_145066_c0_seq1.p1  ORF type:complete len:589 (+),score=77.07 gnl/TRDRNA2_/TRDRNA2_145066_c0_seq1:167-1768(+)
MTTTLEPAVQEALGKVGHSFSFDRDHCNLGSQPLQLGATKIMQTTQVAASGDELQNCLLTTKIEWIADLSVYVKLSAATVGISELNINGLLMIEFVGLKSAPPMFQGLRCYFMNPPAVDFKFHGNLTPVLNLGIVKRKIQQIISESVSEQLVVPHYQGIAVDEDVQIFRVTHPLPRGILEVTVWSAEGLPARDRHLFSGRSSDPYFVLKCGAETSRSVTVKGTTKPKYSHKVLLQIASTRHQRMRIEFYDSNLLAKDYCLGECDVLVCDLVSCNSQEKVAVELLDEAGVSGKCGKVLMSARWRPLLNEVPMPRPDENALVFVGMHSAHHVPLVVEGTLFWATVQCSECHSCAIVQGKQTTSKLTPAKVSAPRRAGETMLLKKKLSMLQKTGLSQDEIAEILEVDAEQLKQFAAQQDGVCELRATARHDISFDQGFSFVVTNPKTAVVTLELWEEKPRPTRSSHHGPHHGTSAQKDKLLGTAQVAIADVVSDPTRTQAPTICLSGCDIVLKLQLQVMFMGPEQQEEREFERQVS